MGLGLAYACTANNRLAGTSLIFRPGIEGIRLIGLVPWGLLNVDLTLQSLRKTASDSSR